MSFVRVFRVLLVIGGVLLLAGLALVFSSTGSSTSSTDSLPAGSYYLFYQFNLFGSGTLRGEYQETTGGSVNLFVLTEVQFESYRAGRDVGSLWSLGSSRAGTIDVALPGSGRYFLVADHGSAYEQVQQEIRFTLRLTGIDPTTFGAGLAFSGAGSLVMSWGVFSRRRLSRRTTS